MFKRRRQAEQEFDRSKRQQENRRPQIRRPQERSDVVSRPDVSKEMHELPRVSIQTAMEWAVLGGD